MLLKTLSFPRDEGGSLQPMSVRAARSRGGRSGHCDHAHVRRAGDSTFRPRATRRRSEALYSTGTPNLRILVSPGVACDADIRIKYRHSVIPMQHGPTANHAPTGLRSLGLPVRLRSGAQKTKEGEITCDFALFAFGGPAFEPRCQEAVAKLEFRAKRRPNFQRPARSWSRHASGPRH
jgi:hypothetical protein